MNKVRVFFSVFFFFFAKIFFGKIFSVKEISIMETGKKKLFSKKPFRILKGKTHVLEVLEIDSKLPWHCAVLQSLFQKQNGKKLLYFWKKSFYLNKRAKKRFFAPMHLRAEPSLCVSKWSFDHEKKLQVPKNFWRYSFLSCADCKSFKKELFSLHSPQNDQKVKWTCYYWAKFAFCSVINAVFAHVYMLQILPEGSDHN